MRPKLECRICRAGLPLLLAVCAFLAGCGRTQPEAGPAESVLFGETTRIRGFDPVKAGDFATALAVSRIYEGLLQYSYLDRPYRLEPLLAAGLPEVSADGLTYVFTLRPDIFFQDDPCFAAGGGKGRAVTAADFVYSILRVADRKNSSTGYWAFQDRIVGLDEFRAASGGAEPTDYAQAVPGLRATDRSTLTIVLKRPYPQILWVLTMPYASAVPREAVEYYGREFGNHPVGTGPFVLKSWRRNYRMEYVRNPQWAASGRVERYPAEGSAEDRAAGLLADAGRPLPFLDRLVEYVIADDTTKWMMFLDGRLDRFGAISRDNWEAVMTTDRRLNRELEARGIRLLTRPTLEIYYLGFNLDDPVVGANRKLRQALTCAFNTESWIQFHNGQVIRPISPIPPGLAGGSAGAARFPFDLERARQLLAEAGYSNGLDPKTGRRLQLTLELASADSAELRQSTELLADFMDKIGVVLQPVYNNKPTFFEKIERRQAQMFRLSWSADYPDAQNFLQLFYSPNASPGPNRANYVNPDFDRLYERARLLPDSPERTELYRQMADLAIEDCPWIFMHLPLAYGLQQTWVKNVKLHDFPFGMEKYYRAAAAERRADLAP
jgi:ABC-type transport system substrate-binding protein